MSNLISINANGMRRFGKAMRGASKEVLGQLNLGLSRVAEQVAAEARANADWSSRIPKSIRTGGARGRAYVKAGGATAPHAAAYEHHGKPGTFRHPVFGNRDVWETEDARPFLAKAADRQIDAGGTAIADSIVNAVEGIHI